MIPGNFLHTRETRALGHNCVENLESGGRQEYARMYYDLVKKLKTIEFGL